MLKEFLTLAELKKLSFTEIRELQNRRLRAIIKHLLPHTALYPKVFKSHGVDPGRIRCVEDWKRFGLPLIKKKLYIGSPRDFIVRPRGDNRSIFAVYLKYAASLNKLEGVKLILSALLSQVLPAHHEKLSHEVRLFFRPKMPAFAGGSESGKPVPVLLTGRQKVYNMVNNADISAYLIITRHFPEQQALTGMNLFPYAPHIAWQVINMAAELRTDFNLCTASGGFLRTEKLLNIAQTFRPNVFSGMVDYLLNVFLPQAIQKDIRLHGKILFLNGATKMLEHQRQQVKKLFKQLGATAVVALDGYGASELKEATLAECEEGSGFHHVSPLACIIRAVKIGHVSKHSNYITDWDFCREGEGGYAALWNIDGAGTLLEGFLLGDHYDKVVHDRCPHCGLNVQRVYNINRIADLEQEMRLLGMDEEKISGTTVDLVALREKILQIKGVQEAQLVIERLKDLDRLIIKYAAGHEHDDTVREKIKEVFAAYSDLQPAAIHQVELSTFYNDPNHFKFREIVRDYSDEIHL